MKRILFSQPLLLTFITIIILWIFVFNAGVTTAFSVWTTSEIFNHCLLIIPISVYLIYEKWSRLNTQPIKPNYAILVPLVACFAVQLFAEVGDIKILMHLATFTALPLLIWFALGNSAAKVIVFPLGFMLFSIPIGDQLVPHLQELTTDIAVPLLNITGVPVYRNGLYLDIPEGRFLVAEACSGISFLITTIAFGFLYAYLFFKSRKKQLLFIAVALLLPIIANAVRVYGIILTGHLTNMEHAVGADHLVYGGVFFGFVLFLLILFGEIIKEKNQQQAKVDEKGLNNSTPSSHSMPLKALTVLSSISIVYSFWLFNISTVSAVPVTSINDSNSKNITINKVSEHAIWIPSVDSLLNVKFGNMSWENPDHNSSQNITATSTKSLFFTAYFDGVNGKLISSVHRDFDQQNWSLISKTTKQILGQKIQLSTLISPNGEKKNLYKWFTINGEHFSSASKAKLYQATQRILKRPINGLVYMILSDPSEEPLILNNVGLSEISAALNSVYMQ